MDKLVHEAEHCFLSDVEESVSALRERAMVPIDRGL